MTGIERLRKLVGLFSAPGIPNMLANDLNDIADQIEREQHEMVADSPYDALRPDDREAIAWVREHGGLRAVKKMAAITLDVYQRLVDGNAGLEMLETDADTIDAMMAEIDEAIVKRGKERTTALALLDESVPRVTYERHIIKRQRQIDESHAALRRRNQRIEELEERVRVRERANDELNEELNAMRPRLMPDGMCWPVFDDGEPVRPGDRLLDKGGDWFEAVSFVFTCDWWSIRGYQTEGFGDLNDETRRKLEGMAYGTCVKRPAPKVLDADGVETHEGDTVWLIDGRGPWKVSRIVCADRLRVICDDEENGHLNVYPEQLTHRAPVLAADGKPIHEGDTVYEVEGTGHAYKVVGIRVGDGDPLTPTVVTCDEGDGTSEHFLPSQLTHTKPEPIDTWERIEEDAGKDPCDYFGFDGEETCGKCPASGKNCEQTMARDIVRRCRALAERERGE